MEAVPACPHQDKNSELADKMCFNLNLQEVCSTRSPVPPCGFPALRPDALTYNSEPGPLPKMEGVSRAQPPRSTSEPPPSAEFSWDLGTDGCLRGSLSLPEPPALFHIFPHSLPELAQVPGQSETRSHSVVSYEVQSKERYEALTESASR